jgi:poly-gamma-glutamate synthesis protein (capsule biosynthesis protein)
MFSSCAAPATSGTPTPAHMAFVDMHHPREDQAATSTAAIPTTTPLPTPRVIQISLWVPAYLEQTMGEALEDPLRGLFVADEALANIRLEVGTDNPVSQWVYALVAPFPSTLDGISSADLLLRWQNGSADSPPLLMDANTHAMFSAMWGPAANGSVQIVAAQGLVEAAWAQGSALALVPFGSLEPRWKVLAVDGLSPIHKDFVLEDYPLKIPISLNTPDGDPEMVALIRSTLLSPLPIAIRKR